MTEQVSPDESLVDQILNQTFETLEALDEFDADTIESLKELSRTNGLRKARRVGEVISEASEDRP